VFEEVTRARATMAQASTPGEAGAADSLLGQALGKLFAVAEAYPDLKASQNFLQLQSDLTDTEDKISAARRYYNATVLAYNNAIQTFPSLLFAGPAGFRAREFFAAAEGDRAPVSVSFPS
jgi:LemA protein